MNPDVRLLRNPQVALAPTDDGYLAYDHNRNKLHRLNPAAALIVELCDGTRTMREVVRELAAIVAGDAEDACRRWIDEAIQNDLLKCIAAGAVAADTPAPDFFSSLARRLRREGHVLAAFVCQYHATLQTPDDAERWVVLGDLAHILGRREDARDAYEQYLELAPGDAEVEHILVSLRGEPAPPRAPDDCIVQLYARFAEFYERNMRKELEYCGPEVLAAALRRELGPATGLDVLDLGCGTGLAGPQLRPFARTLTGVDLSPEMAERARATGVYDAVDIAEITAWLTQQRARDFDIIAACDTLIYFGDLGQVTRPAAARLREHGTFAFTVERGDADSFSLTDSGRYVHSEQHIAQAAAGAGFRIASIERVTLRYEYGDAVEGLVAVLRRD